MKLDAFEAYKEQIGVGAGADWIGRNNKGPHLPVFAENPKPGWKCLDVGFGEGHAIKKFIDCKAEAYGIDASEASIQNAKKFEWGKKANLHKVDASKDKFPFTDNFFDFVSFDEIIEHLENPLHAVFEIKRVLKPDCFLLLTHPMYVKFDEHTSNAGYESGAHGHVYPGLLARETFQRFMMQAFFSVEKLETNGDTAIWLFKNLKLDNMVDPLTMAWNNYDTVDVYAEVKKNNKVSLPDTKRHTKYEW